MTKNKSKVSDIPPSVKEMFISANSLPDGYKFDIKLFPDSDSKKQREWFFELIKSLPADFPKKFEPIDKVVNGESISWEEAISKGSGVIYDEAKKILPLNAKMTWHEFLPSENQVKAVIPLQQLTRALVGATSCRDLLTKICRTGKYISNTQTEGKFPIFEVRLNEVRIMQDPETGILELGANRPISVLIREQIDTRRIKACDNCDDFYWQKRENKNSDIDLCEKCRNKVNQRKYVARNKAETNMERRRNYYYKNKIEACEKCIRPIGKCICEIEEIKLNGNL